MEFFDGKSIRYQSLEIICTFSKLYITDYIILLYYNYTLGILLEIVEETNRELVWDCERAYVGGIGYIMEIFVKYLGRSLNRHPF